MQAYKYTRHNELKIVMY